MARQRPRNKVWKLRCPHSPTIGAELSRLAYDAQHYTAATIAAQAQPSHRHSFRSQVPFLGQADSTSGQRSPDTLLLSLTQTLRVQHLPPKPCRHGVWILVADLSVVTAIHHLGAIKWEH